MRILVVEDDFTSRTVLEKILTDFGNVDVAADGAEGLEAFSRAINDNYPYELVCMDIMMPGMDGKAALKEIRAAEKKAGVKSAEEVKVIMVTALDDPKTVMESFYKSGATAYIVKPIHKDKLVAELSNLGLA